MNTLASHTVDEARIPESPFVLDVGSRNYGFANAVLAIRPNAKVFALEPDPAAPEPTDSRITLIRAALVADGREQEVYESYSTGEGNFLRNLPLKGAAPHVHDAKVLTVPCTNILKLCEQTGVAHWDVVKLDCEGAEFAILENWPGPIATQISVEFHDWDRLAHYPDSYYAELWSKLPDYKVDLFRLTPIGPGNSMGHWDSLISLK